ncbi:MAG: cob(I)yrinic acid a,c-diamide adenosyltransferase [Desulfurococcales archaeon]|nr:cob(I)yrinic acid a,c-diamide adenosyltransferase [Desulfurococcales archaeon]
MVRLYTRTGDSGETYCVLLKKRIGKDHVLIEALGSIDEANSFIGLARALARAEGFDGIDADLEYMQRLLFKVGYTFSGKTGLLNEDDVKRLEEISDRYMEGIEIKWFILPSGSQLSAALHVARSVVRRSERAIIRAFRSEEASGMGDKELILRIVNRLSDALYAIAVHVTVKTVGKLEYV